MFNSFTDFNKEFDDMTRKPYNTMIIRKYPQRIYEYKAVYMDSYSPFSLNYLNDYGEEGWKVILVVRETGKHGEYMMLMMKEVEDDS